MPLVDSVDYPGKRIYLGSGSVGFDVSTIDVYREVRALRASTPNHRLFRPLLVAQGNEPAGESFTPRRAVLAEGARIVPYGGVSHELKIVTELISEDGLAGVALFDRGAIPVAVDITYTPPQVEIVTVNTGGTVPALTPEQMETLATMAAEKVWSYTR